MVWSVKHAQQEKLAVVLEKWIEMKGECVLPIDFVVPESDLWPEDMWGLRLGEKVSRELQKTPPKAKKKSSEAERKVHALCRRVRPGPRRRRRPKSARLQHTAEEFKVYLEIEGRPDVPNDFVVPSRPPWPEHMWGTDIGHRCKHMRWDREAFLQHWPDRYQKLTDLGFVWNRNEHYVDLLAASLRVFKAQNDAHVQVAAGFKVPAEPPWPRGAWGWALGKKLLNIAKRGSYLKDPRARRKLQEAGFDWKF
jgi:hypothetical protein